MCSVNHVLNITCLQSPLFSFTVTCLSHFVFYCVSAHVSSIIWVSTLIAKRHKTFMKPPAHTQTHQLSPCLVPQNWSSSFSALSPTLWIHELLPCHSQSPLNEHRSDLSKWCNVKMLLRGLRFHLHWQLEEHNSGPGGFCEAQRRFLCSDSTFQSDNWPHFFKQREVWCSFQNKLHCSRVWMLSLRHREILCGIFKCKGTLVNAACD